MIQLTLNLDWFNCYPSASLFKAKAKRRNFGKPPVQMSFVFNLNVIPKRSLIFLIMDTIKTGIKESLYLMKSRVKTVGKREACFSQYLSFPWKQ
jgi:hypothetical protein